MKKLLAVCLFFIGFSAHAGLQAIAGTESLFQSLCLEEGAWRVCPGSPNTLSHPYPTVYTDAFYVPATQETVAFGFYEDNTPDGPIAGLVVSCRANSTSPWRDCTPLPGTIPAGRYYNVGRYHQVAHDGEGSFMLIGTNSSNLVVACHTWNDQGESQWADCSPTTNTDKFYPSAVAFGDEEWMVIGRYPRTQGSYTYFPAMCMDKKTRAWRDCRTNISDPTQVLFYSIESMSGLAFIDDEWIATGRGKVPMDDNLSPFESICHKKGDTLWTLCTGDSAFPIYSNQRLIKDDQAGLIQINFVSAGDYPSVFTTEVLCRAPGDTWRNCSGSLKQQDHMYVGAVAESDGKWTLAGNQLYKYGVYGYDNLNYITASQQKNDWDISLQLPPSKQWKLFDVFWVEE